MWYEYLIQNLWRRKSNLLTELQKSEYFTLGYFTFRIVYDYPRFLVTKHMNTIYMLQTYPRTRENSPAKPLVKWLGFLWWRLILMLVFKESRINWEKKFLVGVRKIIYNRKSDVRRVNKLWRASSHQLES